MKIQKCDICGRKPKMVHVGGYYGLFCSHGKKTFYPGYFLQLNLLGDKKIAIECWNGTMGMEGDKE